MKNVTLTKPIVVLAVIATVGFVAPAVPSGRTLSNQFDFTTAGSLFFKRV